MRRVLVVVAVVLSSCVPASAWLVPEDSTPTPAPAAGEERWYLGTNGEWSLRPTNEYPTVRGTP
jgi:hypothetical protein